MTRGGYQIAENLRLSSKYRNSAITYRAWKHAMYLFLPKIIFANNDCVVRRGLGWRGGFHIVVSVVAAAHPHPIQDACASHCNTPNTRSGSAADAVRQRSERDPNSRAVTSRSDILRTGFATATSGQSGSHESAPLKAEIERRSFPPRARRGCPAPVENPPFPSSDGCRLILSGFGHAC